jgi:hypothetical protein
VDPELRYEIEFPMRPERRAMREVIPELAMPSGDPIVRTVQDNVRGLLEIELAVGAVVPRSYAGNDTPHLFAAGIPCCLYGPSAEYDERSADRWTPVTRRSTARGR